MVVFSTALTTAQRAAVENYLYGKWILGVNGNANVLPANSPTLISAGATLDLGGVWQTLSQLSGQGTLTNSASSGVTLTLGGNNGAIATFSGLIADNAQGPLSLVMNGNYTQVFSGTNTYHGSTTVSGGVLEYAGTAALPGSSAITVKAGGTLGFLLGGSGFSMSQGTNLLTTATFNSGSALGIDTSNASATFSGALTAGVGLTSWGPMP